MSQIQQVPAPVIHELPEREWEVEETSPREMLFPTDRIELSRGPDPNEQLGQLRQMAILRNSYGGYNAGK